jgi:hypothetical protein
MEGDIEGQSRIFPTEEPRREFQVSRTADRKEFGERLYDS